MMKDKRSRLPVPQYSYRQDSKKEERRVYRRIALIMTAIFVILVVIWFTGTNFIDALSIFSRNDSGQTTSGETSDLPLQAPKIDNLLEATNQDKITVEGTTTPDVDVNLIVNAKDLGKQKADSSGNFRFDNVPLKEGLNLLKVIATNKSGETQETNTTITLDKSKPALSVSTPADGSNFSADTTTVKVSGTTEADAVVQVNGLQAIVESSGKFSYNLPVVAGDNPIEVSSTDLAGNITSVKLTITVAG